MKLTINPTFLSGDVNVISSKSYSHRYVIAASLAHGKSVLENILESDDLEATIEGLKNLGAHIEGSTIKGNYPKCMRPSIFCKESGSTLRFLIPLALLTNKEMTFYGEGRLSKRPLHVYEELFNEKHIFYKKPTKENLPFIVKGPLVPGDYLIKGNVSSQFVSGLLFALPLLKDDSNIILIPPIESFDYILMTIDVLQQFGIKITFDHQTIHIFGNQTYKPCEVSVEADYSQAAFWMVAAIIGRKITFSNLNPNSKQGDKKIIDVIKEMGGLIDFDSIQKSYQVFPSQTKGIPVDLSQIPDLGPILMILAGLSEGVTTFSGIERLKIKESNRIEAMIDVLTKFGVKTIEEEDTVKVFGQKQFRGNQVFSSYQDHRIAMAIAIGAIRAHGKVIIEDYEVVKKSYPDFFKVYENLGGVVHVD